MQEFKVGDNIQIISVKTDSTFFKDGTDHQAESLKGKKGRITYIDSAGTLWGTWGSLGIIPGEDTVKLVKRKYTVGVTLPLSLCLEIKATSEEEAKEKAKKIALKTPYEQWGDDFSYAEFNILED